MNEEFSSIQTMISKTMYEYLGRKGTGLLDFCGNVIFALIILSVGFKLIKYVDRACRRIFERSNMDATLQTFLLSFIKVGCKVLIIFWAITRIGVGASSIIAVLGSAGLALGLSLQGSLANIAGGVILLLMKPFVVGDYIIESSGNEGIVQAIGIMYTKLLTNDNRVILIPNGTLSNATLINVTYQEKRRVDIRIGVSYEDDIKKVKKVLFDMILQEKSLLQDEPIKIFVQAYMDSCINIELRYWVKTEDYWESKWRVMEEIKTVFDENGITIPFNQMDVNVIHTNK